MEMQKSENKDKRVPLAENVREYDERRFMGRRTRIAAKQSTPGEKAREFLLSLKQDGTVDELKTVMKEGAEYIVGICSNFTSKGYDYWVAVEVDNDTPLLEGCETIFVPAGTYAYFECEGGTNEAVTSCWSNVYNTWFPKSGYNHQGTQEMEIYPLGDMEAEDYRCTLLVPVRRIERVPINKYRRSALGSAPFVLIGSVAGLLISGASDTKTMLIAALVGGGLAWFLYEYIAKRREEREKAKEEAKNNNEKE